MLLRAAAATAVGAALLSRATSTGTAEAIRASATPVDVMPGLRILPRDAWGADLPPKRPMARETPRFLLVHHTASSNSYASAVDVIRSTYTWHTSRDKGWPDVAYNFFVARNGDVYEGRAGSLTRPVVADATGGSQGFAQLVCLLGNFTTVQPTAAALASLAKVLAWLGPRSSIDITPGATTTFVSRGSNRWPAGASVTTATVGPHRDMSMTACPGNALVARFADVREQAFAQQQAWAGVLRPAVRLGQN